MTQLPVKAHGALRHRQNKGMVESEDRETDGQADPGQHVYIEVRGVYVQARGGSRLQGLKYNTMAS